MPQVQLKGATIQERFDYYTRRAENGCLEWVGGLHKNGYGSMRINYTQQYAHRVAWKLHYGVWPDHLVCHKCNNKKCCDWEHLYKATNTQNLLDASASGLFGNGRAHTTAEREQIKQLVAAGLSLRKIGRVTGIEHRIVGRIARGDYDAC
jgi:hypothetical protein